jgi:YVTN family beta-propeller protein
MRGLMRRVGVVAGGAVVLLGLTAGEASAAGAGAGTRLAAGRDGSGGTWGTAREVPGTGTLNPGSYAAIDSTAGGYHFDRSGHQLAAIPPALAFAAPGQGRARSLPHATGAFQAAALTPHDPVLAAAPVGTGPAFAAENYRTHTLYVPDSGDGTVSVVNLTACSALNVSGCAHKSPVIRVGKTPLGIAVDQATNTVYVANADDNTVSVIDGATCDASDTSGCGQRPATVAVGAFVDPVTNTVFVTNQGARPGTVSVIDGSSCNGSHSQGCAHQPLATVTVGGGPSGIAVNPVTGTVYVANTGQTPHNQPVRHGNTLSLIDAAACHAGDTSGCKAIGTVPAGVGPAGVAVDTATNSVYVTDTQDGGPFHEGTVAVINGATCDARHPSGCAAQKPPQVTVGSDPSGVAVDHRTRSVLITNSLDDTVSVLSAAACNGTHHSGCTRRPPTIAVGGAPAWATIDAARRTIYVADSVSNNIAVLSDLTCTAQAPVGCRHPAQTVPAGRFPFAAAADQDYHTVYVGDTNAFNPPFTVSMIDTTACNATDHQGCALPPRTLPGDGLPLSIATNPRTNTVYVAGSGPLQVIGAATCNARTTTGCHHTAEVPAGGYAVAVDPSTDTIYAANAHRNGSGYISVINGRHCHGADTSGCAAQTAATTATVRVGHSPGRLAADPANHTLYVTNIGDHTVSVIDTRHCHAGDTSRCASQTPPVVSVPTASRLGGPFAIIVDHATSTAYVTDNGFPFTPGAMSLINTRHCHAGDTSGCASQTPATIPLPTGGAISVHIDSAANTVYVANNNDSSVSVIDGRRCNASNRSHCRPIRKIQVGSNPNDLTIDAQNDTVYVPNFYDNDASVFPTSKTPPAVSRAG